VKKGGDVVGNIDDAFAAFYGHTQAVLQAQGVEKVRAYRGVAGGLANDLERAVRGETGGREHVVLFDPGASWSDSPFTARGFSQKIDNGEGHSGYALLTREADVAEIIVDRRASPYSIGLSNEHEYILAGDNRRVLAYAEVDDLGAEHSGMGHDRSSYSALLFEVENVSEAVTGVTESMARLENATTPVIPVRGRRKTSRRVKSRPKTKTPEAIKKAKATASAAKAAQAKALKWMPASLKKLAKLSDAQKKMLKLIAEHYPGSKGLYALPKGYTKPTMKKLVQLGIMTDGFPLYSSYSAWKAAGSPSATITPLGLNLLKEMEKAGLI
jgi:hypothetical protein